MFDNNIGCLLVFYLYPLSHCFGNKRAFFLILTPLFVPLWSVECFPVKNFTWILLLLLSREHISPAPIFSNKRYTTSVYKSTGSPLAQCCLCNGIGSRTDPQNNTNPTPPTILKTGNKRDSVSLSFPAYFRPHRKIAEMWLSMLTPAFKPGQIPLLRALILMTD